MVYGVVSSAERIKINIKMYVFFIKKYFILIRFLTPNTSWFFWVFHCNQLFCNILERQ